jgi:LmbE family N-acetylglucosaminyl deacetylase
MRRIYSTILATAASLSCNAPPSVPRSEARCGNGTIALGPRVLIVAPHPDDEVLGFAGVIRDAKKTGARVRVVVVTDGQAHCDACAFWKTGRPPSGDARDDAAAACTRAELDVFGLVRREESLRALALLDVAPGDVRFLGHDDATLAAAWSAPDVAPAPRLCRADEAPSRAAKKGADLMDALFAGLSGPDTPTSLFTTHPKDGHSDHAALHRFVRAARNRAGRSSSDLPIYAAVIHAQHTPNCAYPSPPSPLPDCTHVHTERDFEHAPRPLAELRIARFLPSRPWSPPEDDDYGAPLAFCVDPVLFSGDEPLERAAIETYATQIGFATREGVPLDPRWRGWIDRSGYMLAFVRRTEVLYLEP